MSEPTQETDSSAELEARLLGMLSVKFPDADYYCFTFTGSWDGEIQWSAQTRFAGWTDTRPRRELRVPRRVDPIKMLDLVTAIGEPCLVVNDEVDFFLYLHFGGQVIIRADIVEKYLTEFLEPTEVVCQAEPGFTPVESVPRQKLVRMPSRKLRMRVLKRDSYRCRICGRSPDDYDVVLHVHHIRPWGGGYGGMTEEDNLITLCDTCHDGLEPHADLTLYSRIGVDPFRIEMESGGEELMEGIAAYHAIVQRNFYPEANQA